MVVEASGARVRGVLATTRLSSPRSVSVPVTVDELGFINCSCAPSFTIGKKALEIARERNGTDSLMPLPETTAAASRFGLVLWMRIVAMSLVVPKKPDTVFNTD